MPSEAQDGGVRIDLLGRFRVAVGGAEPVADVWPSRRAAELVQLLALADRHLLARDQVVEALWPHLDVDAGGANLRKAAHHARQALASSEGVVLRGGQVALFPSRSVETDAARFEARADAALAGGEATRCAAAASAYTGDLLPEALYEEWTQAPRERLRSRYVELLRRSGQWERLVEAEPTDESAYRELMRRELAAGCGPAAIRWYGRLRIALRDEFGILPSRETEAIYDECVAGLGIT
jgi:DNA-binding SARP family transcriptional activator